MTNPQAAGTFVTPIAGTAGEFQYVTGDCAIDSDETIHIFFAFAGGSQDLEPLIGYATGGGDNWRSYDTPYRGWVLGMAVDGPQRRFLLFVNSSGVHLGEMAGDQFAASLAVSSQAADWQFSSGDVVASNGKWWAVWSERANPSQPFQMFQASTMAASSDLPLPVGSRLPNVVHNSVPSLTLDPTGPDRAVLAWMVVLNDSSVVRLAKAQTSNAIWHEQAWAPPSPQPGRYASGPDLAAAAGELYGAYGDDDTITYTLDPPAPTATTRFQGEGYSPRVAHSDGRTWVAWRDADDQVVLAEPPATTSVQLKTSPSGSTQRLIGMLAAQGQVTVVGADFADQSLWAAGT